MAIGERQQAGRRRRFSSARNRLKSLLQKRLPILTWLPKYNSEKFISDAIAGITVGLTVMPQGLAYAILAGLEPQVTKLKLRGYMDFKTLKNPFFS